MQDNEKQFNNKIKFKLNKYKINKINENPF